jgi:hypothetical protein
MNDDSSTINNVSAKDEIINSGTKENDRKTVETFLRRIPLQKRLESINAEMTAYFNASNGLALCKKVLPEYCYNIFDKFRITNFAVMPKFNETISGDFELASKCETIAEAKKVIKIDWVRLGRLFGFGLRAKRFVELESANELKRNGLFDVDPEKQRKAIELLIGKPHKQHSRAASVGAKFQEILETKTESDLQKVESGLKYYGQAAYEWGSDAMEDFFKGIGQGSAGFIDENSQLVGETNRSPTYHFLLLAWPEIKEMQGSVPRKTITDLHKWMLPFMRHGMTSLIDVGTLRDICASKRNGGICLKLRPLASRSAKSSA